MMMTALLGYPHPSDVWETWRRLAGDRQQHRWAAQDKHRPPGTRSGWFLFGALSLTDRVVAMGDAKTRKCVWCEKEFTRRSLWRAKRYCKRRHQCTHYGAILVGSLFS